MLELELRANRCWLDFGQIVGVAETARKDRSAPPRIYHSDGGTILCASLLPL
jgi:hypothetical protein